MKGNSGVYSKVKQRYPEATRSFLRLETALSASGGVISFNIRQDVGVKTWNEVRLKQSDSFVITAMAIRIMKITNAAALPTDNEMASGIMRTYPNPVVFANAGEANALMAIFNGRTIIKVNKTDSVPAIRNKQFYRAPNLQQGAGAGVVNPRDGWDGATYGFANVTPTVTLNGQDDVEISIPTPSLSLAGAAGTTNFAVIEFDGLLIPSATLKGKQVWG